MSDPTKLEMPSWLRDLKPPPAPAMTGTCACGAALYLGESICGDCEGRRREVQQRRAGALRAADRTIPARYVWARFDAPELAERVHDQRAIAALRARGPKADRVTLLGPAGVGKTVLATCLLVERAEAGVSGLFVTAYALAVARGHAPLGEGDAELVRRAIAVPLLVIDDLGAEKAAPSSAIADVIHARHEAMRMTAITSGFGVEELKARYGDGIARRLFEGAVALEVKPRGAR